MYRRIVVALDGSQRAEAVLPHVEALAVKFSSAITLVQATMPRLGVVTAPATPMPTADAVSPGDAVSQIQRRDALAYLATIAHEFATRNIEVDVAHDEGRADDVIIKTAEAVQAELIGMTTHGAGVVRRLVLGSVADAVLRSAPCPVLLVRIEQAEDKIHHPN